LRQNGHLLILVGANPTVPGTNLDTVTGIDLDKLLQHALTIEPNPSVVNGSISFNKLVNAKIYDLIGNEVISVKDTLEVILQGLRQGVYVIKTDQNEIRKLVLE
jgi:hypothetical protein